MSAILNNTKCNIYLLFSGLRTVLCRLVVVNQVARLSLEKRDYMWPDLLRVVFVGAGCRTYILGK